MYARIWRLLPGTTPWRLAQTAALAAIVTYALFAWVFPWAGDQLAPDPSLTP